MSRNPRRLRSHSRPGNPHRWVVALATVPGVLLAVLLQHRWNVWWFVACLTAVNLATLLLYAYDKSASRRPGWPRVPERALHAFALLGGSPAALLCQSLLRHKTLKRPFRTWFAVILLVQTLAVLAWVYVRYFR